MAGNARRRRTVKSTERTFDVLEFLHREDGARVTEIAEELGLAKSTVHRYLATLLEREYVFKDGDHYHISLRFLDMGETARYRKKPYELAKSLVKELATVTEERAVFLVEQHGQAVYVHRASGKHAVRHDPGPGKRIPIHATAAGKAILAFLPDKRIDEIIDRRGLPGRTDNTITDPEQLHAELDSIRERGYAVNKEENVQGVRAIGAPILPNDRVIGALSISGPAQRIKEKESQSEQNLLNLLLSSAKELEIKTEQSVWTVE